MMEVAPAFRISSLESTDAESDASNRLSDFFDAETISMFMSSSKLMSKPVESACCARAAWAQKVIAHPIVKNFKFIVRSLIASGMRQMNCQYCSAVDRQ